MKNLNSNIDTRDRDWLSSAIQKLNNDGVVVLRNLDNNSNIDTIISKANAVLKKPSILGSIGYFQKDNNKKIYDGLLLGKEVVEFVANKSVTNLIEKYIGDEVVLNEILLKNDLGNGTQYFPYHRHTGRDVNGPKNKPFGCGAILYLHDTDIGAFCYSLKSHLLNIEDNPESVLDKHIKRDEIKKNLYRINGKKGDLVIFDERGFHGPEQPVKTPRTALLYGFQSKTSTSNKSRTGIPIVISDMINLDSKQLKVIGVGGGTRAKYEDYHARKSVLKTKNYRYSSKLINKLSSINNTIRKLKQLVKN